MLLIIKNAHIIIIDLADKVEVLSPIGREN